MIKSYVAPNLSVALLKLKTIVDQNEQTGKNTVIFCEDRLTLAAERTVCSAVGGTFNTGVYTFARFLSAENKTDKKILSRQGSAMVIRKIIEDNANGLKLFKKLFSPSAAQSVYDTIALLYSSRVSPEDIKGIITENTLFKNKLDDIAFIYSEYLNYLNTNGLLDRNSYLKLLPEVIESSLKIKNNRVILLGFQSFTGSTAECVRSCMAAAKAIDGIFIGGPEDLYTNEAAASFQSIAQEFGGAEIQTLESTLCPEAEIIRKNLFNPESFYSVQGVKTDKVHIFEASDEEEEMEFIAASIKKHVLTEGERYGKISVMLPDVKALQPTLERVFLQYKIPYYIDRRIPLSEHFICSFICDFLNCLSDGCPFDAVNAVISSPLFPCEQKDRDIYRNYLLRYANYRGGATREPNEEVCKSGGYDFKVVKSVKETFLLGFNCLSKGSGADITAGIKKLLNVYSVEKKLEDTAKRFKNEYPVKAKLCAKAYSSAISVLDECGQITGDIKLGVKEYIKILKSGFVACEISLIPPKADAVFVGDVANTANTGSNVVFVASLTDAVPKSGSDTALLTDREITVLENLCVKISPKIRQVNLRSREVTALNICAFRKNLYLTYPVYSNGCEVAKSEIISYIKRLFLTKSGNTIPQLTQKQLNASQRALPYYCCEKIPAVKQLLNVSSRPETVSAIYAALERNGLEEFANCALLYERPREPVSDGAILFTSKGSVTPTTLETYFACPYQNFLKQGLRLSEREEGSMRAVDSGNFIHEVLEKVGGEMNGVTEELEITLIARRTAEELLLTPKYASLTETKSGNYVASALISEAVTVCRGAFEHIKNSRFDVVATEKTCKISLGDGISLYGKIDRVDESDDMVRIIDYKTGGYDASAAKYYMGLKLQLPLYLTAVSNGKRPVGAYYFPASVNYEDKIDDGVFRLQGFMDGSPEVVKNSDTSLETAKKSKYFDAYLSGRKIDSAMEQSDFSDFINYSSLIARKGVSEMVSGNVTPSPAKGVCDYCKMGGSCGFLVGVDGDERETGSLKCAQIAAIVKKLRGDG